MYFRIGGLGWVVWDRGSLGWEKYGMDVVYDGRGGCRRGE